jgi:hypothetical protein
MGLDKKQTKEIQWNMDHTSNNYMPNSFSDEMISVHALR